MVGSVTFLRPEDCPISDWVDSIVRRGLEVCGAEAILLPVLPLERWAFWGWLLDCATFQECGVREDSMSPIEKERRGRSDSEASVEDAKDERIPDGVFDPVPMRGLVP